MALAHPVSDGEVLIAMRDSMLHRGPDDAGVCYLEDGRVALAHRRLAIIDLSPNGRQPMTDCSGRLWITFNGEIYNFQSLRGELKSRGHRFRTASDTEVILEAYRAWGTECVKRLNGMFAFCIYDGASRRLFLARDRAGEKPLYYSRSPEGLVFASELKALMANPAIPRTLDLDAFNHYLAYGYVGVDNCILRAVRKLPPAHAMTYDLEGGFERRWHYWRLPESSPPLGANADDLAEELEALLADSVRRQMVADVPLGIMLSGGLDSSLITALAARSAGRKVKTFTVGFPGNGRYDERPYARVVADHFGTEHSELEAEPASLDLLETLATQYDEPLADSSMLPVYLVSRLIRRSAVVALGGDGGDELFGGYQHYFYIRYIEHAQRLLPRHLRRLMGRFAARALPVGIPGRNYMIGLSGGTGNNIAHAAMLFDETARRRLLSREVAQEIDACAPERRKAELCSGGSALRQATALDFMTYLPEDILVKVDRASMLNSLEVRAPWLDYHVVEFAFSRVPDYLKGNATARKILVRHLARRLLPAELELERKQGFSIPLTSWLRTEKWAEFARSILDEVDPALFDRDALAGILGTDTRTYLDNAKRLFALIMFELWRRRYRISL